jgi:hypothetical protein
VKAQPVAQPIAQPVPAPAAELPQVVPDAEVLGLAEDAGSAAETQGAVEVIEDAAPASVPETAAPAAPAAPWQQTGPVETQLKAKFAEVVARKEPQPQPGQPVDSKDRIAAIFRKVQSDSTKRTVTDAPRKSSDNATDRIANIMRKDLQPNQAGSAQRAPAKPAAPKPADAPLAAAATQPQSVASLFEATPAAPTQASGKIATQLLEWLKAELAAEPEMNHVTVLTIVGALAGYAAQRAIWEGVVQTGGLSPTDVFEVRESDAGEKFYFSGETDKLMGSLDPRYLSIWKIINATSKSTTTDHPDVIELLAHCAATIGTPEFGIPRLPDGRQPNILPRDAVNRLWAKARQHLAKTEPTLWPMNIAVAARSLIVSAQRAVPMPVAVKIVMEAAVPMSRLDPATVPRK